MAHSIHAINDNQRVQVEPTATEEETTDPAALYLDRLLKGVEQRNRGREDLIRKKEKREYQPLPTTRYNLD